MIPKHAISKISILIILALILTQIFVSNQLADSGARLSQLEDQIANLNQQNQQLQQTIVTQTALSAITQQAPQLGYDRSPRLVKISPPASLALDTHSLNP